MASAIGFAANVQRIEVVGAELADRAAVAGPDATVPTCPGWTVADLVAHQGMVHRWARANLRAEEAPYLSEASVLEAIGAERLIEWYREGVSLLVDTLRGASPDVEAMVFLADAPTPRDFWARRQAHETTMHAVDALAAELGRLPSADDVGLDRDLALDGIDELVTGFMPRKGRGIRSDEPFRLAVVPSDSQRRWTLDVGPDGVLTERALPDDVDEVDAVFGGTAARLYLGLWNRGDELDTSGRAGVLDLWRGGQRIRWSR